MQLPRLPVHDLDSLRRRHGPRYKWLVLTTVMIGTMASFISTTIVNVAIPEISSHFAIGQEQAQWVFTAFMLAMTLSLPVTAWLLQRYGLRRTYTAALLLLAFGGVVGGLSINFTMMIAGRVLEGIAGGILQPIPNVIILRAFGEREQGRAMGIFGLGIVFAPAIGPTVGGLLVDWVGWRAVFFVVVPFCLGALLLVVRYLPRISSFIGERQRFDWKGHALLSMAILCLLAVPAFVHADAIGVALALAFSGTAGLVGVVAYQLRRTAPLLELRLFTGRPFAMGALVSFLYGTGLFGSAYLLPLFMQMGLDYSPSRSGLVLMPAGLALGMILPLAGRLADRLPPSRLVVTGLIMLAASIALTALVPPRNALAPLIGWTILGRVGLGLVLPALNLGALRSLAPSDLPQASGLISFLRQLGGATGVSLVGVVLEWRLAAHGASSAHEGVEDIDRVPAFHECLALLALIMLGAAIAAAFIRPRRSVR